MCDALYIHIPFCERKCPYCDFYSVAADEALMDAYTEAAIRSIGRAPYALAPLDTVYFGGGTPSVLGGRRLSRILEAADARFGIASGAEITVECNPHSALGRELSILRAAGVNRLSFGMQSADDGQLRRLGRLHTAADVVSAVETARGCGFAHFSLDLMLATPGQTPADIDRAVGLCGRLGAEHVSAYLLKIEPGTPFDRQGVAAACPDEEGQAAAYLHAAGSLEAGGWRQYEISNFAREGRVARHNLKYWDCREYLGVGPSAHSFVNGRRFYFPRDLRGFLASGGDFSRAVDDGPGGDAEEYLMLRLRLSEGVRWDALAARYPGFGAENLREKARRIPGGLITLDSDGLRLTAEGFLLSNTVIGELLG